MMCDEAKRKKKIVKQTLTVVSYGETTIPEMGEERKETKKKQEERTRSNMQSHPLSYKDCQAPLSMGFARQ